MMKWFFSRLGPLERSWHRAIIADAEAKLGRRLTAQERQFIISRGGTIAMEMIHDTIRSATPGELEAYLRSE